MRIIDRPVLAAIFLACMSGVAAAQVYDEPEAPVMAEQGGGYAPESAWSAPRAARPSRHGRYANERAARRGHGHMRHHRRHYAYEAPIQAYTPPALASTIIPVSPVPVIYAQPAPRSIYYNEPMIVDGLRTRRAWSPPRYDGCGDGCLRSAY